MSSFGTDLYRVLREARAFWADPAGPTTAQVNTIIDMCRWARREVGNFGALGVDLADVAAAGRPGPGHSVRPRPSGAVVGARGVRSGGRAGIAGRDGLA